MATKKSAKRAVALETCKQLHMLGLLDEHLLPCGTESPLLDSRDLFPLYVDEQGGDPQPGTRKRKKRYHKAVSQSEFCTVSSDFVWRTL
jgi:endoribonuclease Dicer